MNTIDLICLIVLVIYTIRGFVRGLIRQMVSAASFFIAVFAAYRYFAALAPIVKSYIPLPAFFHDTSYSTFINQLDFPMYFYNAIAFFLIFFSVRLAIVIVGSLLHFASKVPGIHIADQLLGALLAFAEMFLLMIVVFHVLIIVPSPKLQLLLKQSYASDFFLHHVSVLSQKLLDLWKMRNT
ncbi:MAG: hypothetical protein A2189_08365 [Paenibacillus sp. RIFOXYA1_FULL_44_5]|nr:MAG: hypothetical protein A2189_08365 [Paenibacillus sp. RIFOXYA1_FULL_44_5]